MQINKVIIVINVEKNGEVHFGNMLFSLYLSKSSTISCTSTIASHIRVLV